jgi:FecR protein
MKTFKVLAVASLLAGILFVLTISPAVMAQDDQAPPPSAQNQGPPPDAQNQGPPPSPENDPPGRVARLNYSTGSVSFQPGGEGDWVEAVRNRPMTTGDNLWADKDSRAEFQIGSTTFRMDSETSVTFLQLDDRTTQMRLSQGSIIFRVRHLDDDDQFEIDTPNSAFVVNRTGEYRVDVNSTGDESDISVFQGRGEVTGGGSSYTVIAGQLAKFTGTDQLNHEIDQIPDPDDFTQFAFGRDSHEDRSESANYISTEMTGYEDLDEAGTWHYAADYGPVWTPVGIASGWAPYRFGHWVFVEPWGWTWVDDEPWGFAPFHYGRWAFIGGGWSWVPGPVVVRPVYAPAFVAFVGGPGFAVGVGVGPSVAWFPLAPREVFVPWYRTSPVYVQNVNITNTRVNVTQVTNVYNTTVINSNTTVNRVTYANQHGTGAVTAVSHDTFANARPVNANLVRVDEAKIANAPVARTVPVQPARASVMGAGRPSTVRPPAAVMNRQVVATHTPTPPRQSFEQRQAAANIRTEKPAAAPQPLTRNESQAARTQEPAANNRPEATQNESRPAQPARPQYNVPRPPASRPAQAAQSHPLVKQAPPVQEQKPEQQRSEEQKFNNWQRNYSQQKTAPRPPQPKQPPAHQEKPHK